MYNMKPKFVETYTTLMKNLTMIVTDEKMFMKYVEAMCDGMRSGSTYRDVGQQIQSEITTAKVLLHAVKEAKTVIFPLAQADVFTSVTRDYTDKLDYLLPFPNTILQFSEPIPMPVVDPAKGNKLVIEPLIAILLNQTVINEESIAGLRKAKEDISKDQYNLLSIPDEIMNARSGTRNTAIAIWSDFNTSRFSWVSDSPHELACEAPKDDFQGTIQDSWAAIKRLAVACIGYINCENVYLHREGEVHKSINEKRERKGKSKLEPYYVCRIRGVQYDASGNEKGEGAKHGIRYDVRGHFRRMATGKTTWVRPHQRGLANELYIPKTYVVDKKVTA